MSAPKVYAVVSCGIDISNGVFQAVVMVFSRCGVRLRKFDAHECNIGRAGRHGPNQLANARFIFNLHLGGQSRLFVGIARANGGVEFLDPSGIGREWGRTILGQRYLFEPSVKVFFAEFVNVRF